MRWHPLLGAVILISFWNHFGIDDDIVVLSTWLLLHNEVDDGMTVFVSFAIDSLSGFDTWARAGDGTKPNDDVAEDASRRRIEKRIDISIVFNRGGGTGEKK